MNWDTDGVSLTLQSRDYKDPQCVVIQTEPIVLESNQNHATITDSGICPTLSESMGLGGGYVPMITESVKQSDGPVIALQGSMIGREDKNGPQGPDVVVFESHDQEKQSEMMSAFDPNELCIEMTSTKNTIVTNGICPTLTARMETGGGQVNAVLDVPSHIQEDLASDFATSDVVGALCARDYKGVVHVSENKHSSAVGGEAHNVSGTQNTILQVLCETYGTQTVVEWGVAVLEALQPAAVLRQGMYEESDESETESRDKLDDSTLPCAKSVAEWLLRDMRKRSECGCSPQGQQPTEQRNQQSATTVPIMPLESTQRCKEMFDMWQKGQGIGLLQQALSEIQKARESSCNKTERCHYIVRRLTPLEAERLQGLPDRWTDIGDWVDDKGKKHKCSDAARYKAIGNGIAVPPWLWVLSRLNQFCEDKTMASLFDGVGTFPMIWSFLNGKENCVWSSEIEPFPIAVSKYHFPDEDESEQG